MRSVRTQPTTNLRAWIPEAHSIGSASNTVSKDWLNAVHTSRSIQTPIAAECNVSDNSILVFDSILQGENVRI